MSAPAVPEHFGILAGNGAYPRSLAAELVARGHRVIVAGLEGHFIGDPPPRCAAFARFPVGALRATVRFFLDHGTRKIFLAGGVRRHEAWRGARPDLHALALVPRLLTTRDDSLLRAVARAIERLGAEVCDPAPFIGRLLAVEGLLAGPAIDSATRSDILAASDAARELGRRDAGQAAVALRGRVVAVEGTSGTNALIADCPGPGAVLAKVVKPGQDRRFDLPAIGPATALLGRAVGLKAIAVEKGGVLLLDRTRLMDICDRHQISLVGTCSDCS